MDEEILKEDPKLATSSKSSEHLAQPELPVPTFVFRLMLIGGCV